jgi:hypothetical protein
VFSTSPATIAGTFMIAEGQFWSLLMIAAEIAI